MPVESAVEIYNKALRLIGAEPVSSIDDSSKAGNILRNLYPMVLDKCLMSGVWGFALKRFQPTEVSLEDNKTKYAHGYSLVVEPPMLRLVDVLDNVTYEKIAEDYLVENWILYTNYLNPIVRYVERTEQADRYPDWFVDYLAYQLAYEIAFPMRGENRQDLYQMAVLAYSNAVRMNMGRMPKKRWVDYDWVTARWR